MQRKGYLTVGTCLLALAVAASLAAAPQEKKQTGTKAAAGQDFQAIARQIVHESVQVKEQDGVLITGDATKIRLMEAIAVEVAKAGGFPHMILESPEAAKRILTETPMQYLQNPNKLSLAEVQQANVVINLSAVEDPATFASVPEERVALARKAGQVIADKFYQRPLRALGLGNPLMPTAAIARFYGVPLQDLEKRFWDAVNTPHLVVESNGEKVRKAIESGREIRIRTQAGTDLRLRLAGNEVTVNDGQIHNPPADKPAQVWLPAGEVFTAPDRTSVNGTVVVPFIDYRGNKIRNARLTFEAGRLAQIQAQNGEFLKDALAKATGDKDFFSFLDIGVNPNSTMIPKSDYCSFEMAGMVTIGIGQAPWAESPNQTDFSQEFFIPEATLEVDGKTIIRDGKIQI
jgi:leucyl aminopeptidase (aminopeptidase T)